MEVQGDAWNAKSRDITGLGEMVLNMFSTVLNGPVMGPE